MHDTHKAAFEKIAGRGINEAELKLFTRAFDHPVVGRFAEWVPSTWLRDISNPDVKGGGGLGDWARTGSLPQVEEDDVSDDVLFADMLDKGMRDPFIAGVGRVTRTVRLEAGNHRIHILLKRGILFVPAVAYVGDTAITLVTNGVHEGMKAELKIPKPDTDIMGPYPIKEYMKLSDALIKMPV